MKTSKTGNKAEVSLTDERVDALYTTIEEATRATDKGIARFIEPARGVLNRAKSRRHHIVFGRRGSGKSSLLRKTRSDLSINRKPVSFVDVEQFKDHIYPDVLTSILIASLGSFRDWLDAEHSTRKKEHSLWNRLFGADPKGPPIPKEEYLRVRGLLTRYLGELNELLHSTDSAVLTFKDVTSDNSSVERSGKAALDITKASAEVTSKSQSAQSASQEIEEKIQRSKIDILLRKTIDMSSLFRAISDLGGGEAFLILDDLYHLRQTDQPRVVDYFHRIAKSSGVWIKVGTIRHRTLHYVGGNPPFGMKIGDDADAIDLDLTLEKYELAKAFLESILQGLASECNINDSSKLLSRKALDRLVIASGGVARDFLTIFRRSIDFAREHSVAQYQHRGGNITAEDINMAAGQHDGAKREELKRDAGQDQKHLEGALQKIREFCVEKRNTNCFLIDQDYSIDVVNDLVDLKMLHLVKSRVTVPDRTGKLYTAYMLDLSQYAGERARRDLEWVEFWKPDSKEVLRKVKLIFTEADLGNATAT